MRQSLALVFAAAVLASCTAILGDGSNYSIVDAGSSGAIDGATTARDAGSPGAEAGDAANDGVVPSCFEAQVPYAATGPSSVAVGDFNGDSKPDIAVANFGSNSVGVLLNAGSGTFAAQVPYVVGNEAQAVAVGDFNGDGKPDLAVVRQGSDTVGVLLNAGSGTFAAQVTYPVPVGSGPMSVAVGDFNGDGRPDLAVANGGSATVSVLLNAGSGIFAAQVPYPVPVGSDPVSVVVGDFNGDSKPDIAVANLAGTVCVLLNAGSGTFAASVPYTVGSQPFSVAVGDFNGDGRLDIAVANEGSDTVCVLLNAGSGTFAAQVTYPVPVGSGPMSVAVGDFNGDGRPDLAVANGGSGTVGILLNLGTGTFAAQVPYAVGTFPESVGVGDFNGDGRLDIAVANSGSSSSDTVGVLLECQ